MAAAGSSGFGATSAGGGEVEYGTESPPIPSVPGNDSPYDDTGADILDILRLVPSTHYSLGVYTHSSGDYYLIRVKSGKLYAAQLFTTEPGEALAERYASDYPAASERSSSIGGSGAQVSFEAYILGQVQSRSEWVEIGEYRLEGSTFQYGWNFNWNGSEAVCVTQQRINNVDGQIIDWTARQYKLTVVEDVEDEEPILRASIALEEAASWQPKIIFPNIWFPDGVGGMGLWMPYGCGESLPDGYGEGDFDVPVFVEYSASEDKKVTRYSQDVLPDSTLAQLIQEADEATCKCYGHRFNSAGVHTVEYEGFADGYLTGFYSDGLDYRVYNAEAGYYRKKTYTIGEPYDTTNYLICGDPKLWNERTNTDLFEQGDRCKGLSPPRCYFQFQAGNVERLSEDSGGTTGGVTGRPIMVLPYHSCESVYIGALSNRQLHLTVRYEKRFTPLKVRQWDYTLEEYVTDFIPVYFPVINSDEGLAYCDNPSNDCNTETIWPIEGCGESWRELESDVTTETTTEYTVSLGLVTPFEDLEVDSVTKESIYDLGSYGGWFFPEACGDFAPINRVTNYQSALGNSIRLESGFDYSYGSNNSLTPAVADPYCIWIGRS